MFCLIWLLSPNSEPSARQDGEIPRRVRDERWAADECQCHRGADGDPRGVFQGEQGHGQGVVDGLGDVETVEPQLFDASRIGQGPTPAATPGPGPPVSPRYRHSTFA